ncbi:MAG TPA: carboxypeptidase-like regulatory domain-containing protein, partial [Candidatus Binataceae bacterium]|nr:carboxypeptidase-like regulatory domain-containing protein [Candidatus Binataceae bacterium]
MCERTRLDALFLVLQIHLSGRSIRDPAISEQSIPNQGGVMSKLQSRVIWISFVALALMTRAFAQGGATGAIIGTIEDPSGAFVSNAEVHITNQETGVLERSVTSGADGSFTAPLLPAGKYT